MFSLFYSFSPYCHFEIAEDVICLYVLNQHKMYQIEGKLHPLIKIIKEKKIIPSSLEAHERALIEELINKKLLFPCTAQAVEPAFYYSGFEKRGNFDNRTLELTTLFIKFQPREIQKNYDLLISQFVKLNGENIIFDLTAGYSKQDITNLYASSKKFNLNLTAQFNFSEMSALLGAYKFDRLIVIIQEVSQNKYYLDKQNKKLRFLFELNEHNQHEMLPFLKERKIKMTNMLLNFSSIASIHPLTLAYIKQVKNKLMEVPPNVLMINENYNLDAYSTIYLAYDGKVYLNHNYKIYCGNFFKDPLHKIIRSLDFSEYKKWGKKEFQPCKQCPFRLCCYYSVTDHDKFLGLTEKEIVLCERADKKWHVL